MCEQEFQQNYYHKGQRVGWGRETMQVRHEEKRMNNDGSYLPHVEVWCARVALSRLSEIIHVTTIL
jgi:hypothetical protein